MTAFTVMRIIDGKAFVIPLRRYVKHGENYKPRAVRKFTQERPNTRKY